MLANQNLWLSQTERRASPSLYHEPQRQWNWARNKYLGIDDSFSFKPHIEQLMRELKSKLAFYLRNTYFRRTYFYVCAIITCLSSRIHAPDTVYHDSLRFITNSNALTHHCSWCSWVGRVQARSLEYFYLWGASWFATIIVMQLCYL